MNCKNWKLKKEKEWRATIARKRDQTKKTENRAVSVVFYRWSCTNSFAKKIIYFLFSSVNCCCCYFDSFSFAWMGILSVFLFLSKTTNINDHISDLIHSGYTVSENQTEEEEEKKQEKKIIKVWWSNLQ